MSRTKIQTSAGWTDPANIKVFNGTSWVPVTTVRVLTATGWEEVWPAGFPNSGTLDADWWVLTIWWRDGTDLDIRVFGCEPDIGQDDSTLIGWFGQSEWPPGDPLLTWGGDRTGAGLDDINQRQLHSETVLIDVNKYRTDYPTATEIKITARGFWYGTPGNLGVVVGAVGYVGGTPSEDPVYYYTVPDATDSLELQESGNGQVVTLATTDPSTTGEFMATFRYNLDTHFADFIVEETGCEIPSNTNPSPTLYYTAAEGSVISGLLFSSSVPEGYVTDITASDVQITEANQGDFGATQVPTSIAVRWNGPFQEIEILEYVWGIPWSGPFPPAEYVQAYDGTLGGFRAWDGNNLQQPTSEEVYYPPA